MATLIWTEPAVADLEEIGQFISKDNPPAAEKVGSKIIREAENVAAFPRLGRIVPEFGNPQIREIISQSYRVIYKFDEEGDLVAILRGVIDDKTVICGSRSFNMCSIDSKHD